jgi:hypothetical protein
MPKCATCLKLLRQGHELSLRAHALDEQVVQSTKVPRGCATPALAIMNRYDADLEAWQAHVADHLAEGAIHE